MKSGLLALVALVGICGLTTAHATTFSIREFTCPIGGEVFQDQAVGSTSSWGQRPDGKAIGGLSPWPVIECPDNGFPIFKDEFEEEELAVFAEAIATPEFAQLRENDTSYQRVWWLQKQVDAEPYRLASLLLRASWQTDQNPSRKTQYQIDFARAADALVREEDRAEDWFWLNLRAANAYREAREFKRASAIVEKINQPDLLPEEADQKEAAIWLISGLNALIAEENSVSEPTNLMGARNAVYRCDERPSDMTTAEVTACESPEYLEELGYYQKTKRQD